ncbi:unnamed protein product [Litomosoides sigmodontis]|uniref:MAM domain-containing protein n=1 Tax=Litomosoides sigmodontis TaxID=42156 RepID=A0A3P6TWB2_LITSI|nr:unnamed protein product [Litomosoides sigmodontis]
MLSKVISQVNTSADLNCSFESACQWRNDTAGGDSGDFFVASDIRVGDRFNIIPLKNNSDEVFAYTYGPFDGMQKATLISNTISCQLGGGTLTFWYYRTGELSTLEVCVQQPPGSLSIVDLRCFPVFPKNHAHQWLFNNVEFPPLTQPFELLIRSTYIQPFDIIAIDDIIYDATLCGKGEILDMNKIERYDIGKALRTANHQAVKVKLHSNFTNINGIDSKNKNFSSFVINGHRKSQSIYAPQRSLPLYASPSLRKSVSKPILKHVDRQLILPCPLTDCSFDAVSMCNYKSYEQLQDDEDLLLDGWFAYAGETNNPAAIFLMRTSKAIKIAEQSRISFFVHMAGKYGRLRVCLDSLNKCPFERTGQALSVQTRKWTNFHMNISRGFHTIYFVADKLRKNYVIGLDHIQLLIKHDEVSTLCTR